MHFSVHTSLSCLGMKHYIYLGIIPTAELATHKYFMEAVAGVLLCKKGFKVDKYRDMICEPQAPIDEVAIVLFPCMYKIHVCIFLEGKYFTTNRDQALNKATMYLVYCGKNTFYDTAWKDSLHWSLVEAPESKYDFQKLKPKNIVEPTISTSKPSG